MRETLVELHSGTITDSELTGGASGTQLLGQGTVLESHLAAGMLRLGASQQRPPSSAVEEKELEEASRRRLSKPDGSTWKSSATVLLLCVLVILQLKQVVVLESTEHHIQELFKAGPLHRLLAQTESDKEPPTVASGSQSNALPLATSTPCNCSKETTPLPCSPASPYVPPVFDTCQLAIVGGRKRDGYGSWPLCINQVPKNAIVYSFGIGLDASFDAAMMKRGARVFGFDPTIRPNSIPGLFGPDSPEYQTRFSFMQVGLGSSNGVATFLKANKPGIQSMTALGAGEAGHLYSNTGFQAAVLTLPALMAIHGHDHIDLLKVDIEGIEFLVCSTPEFLNALPRVGQIIYEFHERLIKNPWGKKNRCIKRLADRGFTMVNKTETEEYVFSRVSPGAKVVRWSP